MATLVESTDFANPPADFAAPSRWTKLGLIAMASAVLGGMATAWWYRKTLIRLRQAESIPPDPKFGISEDDWGDG